MQHQEPDRVPLFYRDVPEVEERLLRDLNLTGREELLRCLEIDFRWVEPDYTGPTLGDPDGGVLRDIWGVEFRYTAFNEQDGYWEASNPPLAECRHISDLDQYPWPKIEWFDFSTLSDKVQQYDDYAIMTAGGHASPGILLTLQNMMGIQKAWTDLVMNPELIEAAIDYIVSFQSVYTERMFEAAGGRIDFFRMGDDFGGQNGLLMSRECWLRLFQQPLMKLAKIAKSCGAYYYHHSCGAIRELIPDLIETGVDVLDPVQVKAKGMVPSELKGKFGRSLCFSGGVDEQELLPNGTPDQVKDSVHSLLNIMARDGGFFIGPTHNFQVDIPTENILALYRAAQDWKA